MIFTANILLGAEPFEKNQNRGAIQKKDPLLMQSVSKHTFTLKGPFAPGIRERLDFD